MVVAREQTHRRREINVQQPAEQRGAGGAQQNDAGGQRVQAHALVTEGREETRPELQSDGEHEQHQAELLHEIQHHGLDRLLDLPGQMAEHKRGKQHTGGSEANPADFQVPQNQPGHGNRGQGADGVSHRMAGMEFEDPIEHGRKLIA